MSLANAKNRRKTVKIQPQPVLIFVIFAVVLIVQTIFAIVLWRLIPEPTNRGLFGDMFGALNALFSGLAFAGIVYTLIQQRAQSALDASANERASRLSAISVLVNAYAERAKYYDSRASPDSSKVQSYYAKVDTLAILLENELELAAKS